jgi:hypothetical protein
VVEAVQELRGGESESRGGGDGIERVGGERGGGEGEEPAPRCGAIYGRADRQSSTMDTCRTYEK